MSAIWFINKVIEEGSLADRWRKWRGSRVAVARIRWLGVRWWWWGLQQQLFPPSAVWNTPSQPQSNKYSPPTVNWNIYQIEIYSASWQTEVRGRIVKMTNPLRLRSPSFFTLHFTSQTDPRAQVFVQVIIGTSAALSFCFFWYSEVQMGVWPLQPQALRENTHHYLQI